MRRAQASLALSFLAAAAVHGGGLAWVFAQPAPHVRRAQRPPTTVRLVARTPPPAPAPRPEPAPGRARETDTPRAARAEPRSVSPAARPPAPAPEPAPQPPRRFAVSMDAVVPGSSGGLAMPTTEGRTAARGDPTLPSSAPVGDNAAPPAADVTEVERAPKALRQPSAEEIRALYPEPARAERLEQDVRVDLLVSERGAVVQVRVRSGGANAFGEAAAQVARRIVFEPASRGGRPVAVWIPWTVKFRLDG